MFPREEIERSLILEHEEILRKIDFIEKSAAERNLQLLAHSRSARQRAAEEKAEGFNPFFILFHVLDPDRFLRATLKYVRWLWTPPVVAGACVFFAWTIGVIIVHWSEVWGGTKVLYALGEKPFLEIVQFILIITFLGAIHESAHGYVTILYGGEVHDIGIALVYATPAFYCNTTDSLLFENRWHELWVTTAGIYIEAWICSLATVCWIVSYPDTFLHEFAFKTMLYHGRLDALPEHQPAHQDRRLLRADDPGGDLRAPRGVLSVHRRLVPEAPAAASRRGPRGLAPQAADLLDLRDARSGVDRGHHAVHRRPLLQPLPPLLPELGRRPSARDVVLPVPQAHPSVHAHRSPPLPGQEGAHHVAPIPHAPARRGSRGGARALRSRGATGRCGPRPHFGP